MDDEHDYDRCDISNGRLPIIISPSSSTDLLDNGLFHIEFGIGPRLLLDFEGFMNAAISLSKSPLYCFIVHLLFE